jgi:hypothetical protein
MMMFGSRQTTLKTDLMELAREKLKELGDFPVNITPDLKYKITTLQEEFLELRQTKKFTEDKGIMILREIDEINKAISELPRKSHEEDRKKKIMKPKSKRKVVKRSK